ncbi:18S rRNA maturation protein [Rhizophlyctis rosea]|uniref:rRNA-processing protein EFG1 n=1 Tax=Rhizophlyctis rosea TaxID=64517 RepID=A0AAD5X6H5_9FUNG|nr:18S rRNA maturation protein [Rhizophlyctis rosea]
MAKKRKAEHLPTVGNDAAVVAKPSNKKSKDITSSEPNPKKARKAETEPTATSPDGETSKKKRRGPPNPLARKYGHHVHGPAKGGPPGGASGIRKRIRDTERLLKKANLPANTRVELERRLKALNIDLSKLQRSDLEEKLHKKYKYVKFVEEKKINRKVSALQKKLETSSPTESKTLQKDLSERLTDLAYIKYFPRDMKYISVVADNEGSTKTEDQRSAIRKFIEEARSAGKLDQGAFAVRRVDVFGKGEEEGDGSAEESGDEDVAGKEDGDDFFMAGSEDEAEVDGEQEEDEEEDGDDEPLPVKVEKAAPLGKKDKGQKQVETERQMSKKAKR